MLRVEPMKKLIVSLTLAAFAVAYADDAKPAKETKATKEKEPAGCCSAAKAAPTAKTACAESAKAKTTDCGSCCGETPVKRTALLSPKAAAERGL